MGLITTIATMVHEYLKESAKSDVIYSKESKRIYNKIKNNIEKIIFTPTDHFDFVKDMVGRAHFLEGVKFNLKQLNENYDLDIFFVYNIDKRKGTNHHFDPKHNRLVFFILSQGNSSFEGDSYLARLRFKSWVGESVFIHEFIHYLDYNRYGESYSFKTKKNIIKYYNSPEEYNAYSHEIIRKILANKNKLTGISFDAFLEKSYGWGDEEFIKNLNYDYRKKLEKRLYKIFVEINTVPPLKKH